MRRWKRDPPTNSPPPEPPKVALIATAAFALAFALRLVWILRVQSPLDAEYSDMGGYTARADELLAHRVPGDLRILTIYPFGTHYLTALEFLALGRHAAVPIAVLHALVGAIPAACAPFIMVRLLPRLWAAAFVGALVAFWVPQIAFSGFFLSEIWFSAAISLHAALSACEVKRAIARVGAGLVAALAFVVRPQFLLTWALDMGGRALSLLRSGGVKAALRGVLWLTLPVLVTLGASSVRLHRLSGHWGLISDNGIINRVWADTDLCRLIAHWQISDGGEYRYEFSPPSRQPCPSSRTEEYTGFIADPEILGAIRREHLRAASWSARIARKFANVRLLVDGNLPWPESNYRTPAWREALQTSFAAAFKLAVLPLCALGMLLGPRNAAMRILVANLVAVVVAAAIFFGEARYHIPYDPFAIMLAIVGAHEMSARAVRLARRWRAAAAKRVERRPQYTGTR